MKQVLFKIKNRFCCCRSNERDIEYEDLKKMLESGKRVIILDVRTKDEYNRKTYTRRNKYSVTRY